jgi:hypothetical protein
MDRLRPDRAAVVRRAGRLRVPHRRDGAAGPRDGPRLRRDDPVHRGHHPPRPERLAVAGRPGDRHRLGARRLRRPGLVGRLAAPGVPLPPRRLGARAARQELRRTPRGGPGRPARPAEAADARQHLRPGHGGADRLPGSPRRLRGQRQALRRRLRQGPARVRHPGGRADRPRAAAGAGGLLLLGVVGLRHRPPGPAGRQLHAELAARAAHRQPADGRRGHLERGQLRAAAGGDRRDGVVLRRWAERRGGGQPDTAPRSAAGLRADAVAEGDVEILLRRRRHAGGADLPGRADGALRSGGERLLRHPARQGAALRGDTDVAPPARRLVDRDGVAGHRAVRRPRRRRAGAGRAALAGQRTVRGAAGHRGRLADRRMAERAAAAARRRLVLVRPPGLRVRRDGPLLATPAVVRPVPVVRPDGGGCGRRCGGRGSIARSWCCS